MRGVVIRFFKFDALNAIPEVYTFAYLIYGALVIITWFSIRSQEMRWVGKFIWFAVVTFIPIAGPALYSVFCLYKADYSYLRRFGVG
ncbi:MAG: PLDc N-terminal domain-containing protein [Verrucomicrobiales bacterium]|nr:PLDc N-terminal domain-containing protein [Verrucomicrobiales bacterium]